MTAVLTHQFTQIGESSSGLKFFNAQRVGAPNVHSGFGKVFHVTFNPEATRRLSRRRRVLVFGPRGQQFALRINRRGGVSAAAADTRNAFRDWIVNHLMVGGTVRQRMFPLHWLQLTPPAFPRDAAYRQHFRYSSELWYSTFPGQ